MKRFHTTTIKRAFKSAYPLMCWIDRDNWSKDRSCRKEVLMKPALSLHSLLPFGWGCDCSLSTGVTQPSNWWYRNMLGWSILTCNSLSPPKKTFSIPKKEVPDFSCGTVLCYESRIELRLEGTWGICTRRAGKLYRARSRLYRSQILFGRLKWEKWRRKWENVMLQRRWKVNRRKLVYNPRK